MKMASGCIHSSQFTNNLLKPSTDNVGKSTGRPTVATPDVVQNVEEIVEEHPHISIRRLSQEIGSH
jgi:hypothetical protein